jgi:small subunit ribosomal protein S14
MAKVSMIQRDIKREKMAKKYAAKREALLAIARDRSAKPEDVFQANMKLAKLPKNAMPNRQRNRCALTGRPRGYHGKFNLCRVKLRELASTGQLPGVTKASW